MMSRFFLPYDVYERHKKVASFIETGQTVVDIGGELGHLSQFLSGVKVTVANLKSGDVIISEDYLPFDKNSFDIVCSIDVLEHLPTAERKKFIARLTSVAAKKIILSFPIGTKMHNLQEKKIIRWLKKKGKNVQYLEEHIKYHLPRPKEIKKLTNLKKTQIVYSGNIYINKYLFYFYMFDPQIKFIRQIVYFTKLLINFLSNPILYAFLSNRKFADTVNRAYLIIEKVS
ncbi:MAG: hypothetical protein UU05_C0002G0031 [Candidatus Curtissbacteria bacterium GW2011_GWA1_40_47]|nr:MAG: hypothetical protein UT95_C0001G0032 [Candidatus Curtissbacteria bacterium GW2011_GWB1_40_28]KKR62318.1 MAG: glycosyl transferase family 2 [Microgenomates group bacterium GW2011_GWC1_40_35]KKR66320.1 MAG: hypothetical protein UU05_C0002G0031 [Candidatus Curtissbacteria bacterium GW2011_GWA1_40_47]KKR77859.1 MAG: hypothetical protein UU19_C0001G0005 [Candidatus Curtissbacteria bacterium GW2011_GWD1_40_8]KKS02486.1 MAG: hypothetical protein UU53_C0001G0031 [Candidatus Curtissbacteria bact